MAETIENGIVTEYDCQEGGSKSVLENIEKNQPTDSKLIINDGILKQFQISIVAPGCVTKTYQPDTGKLSIFFERLDHLEYEQYISILIPHKLHGKYYDIFMGDVRQDFETIVDNRPLYYDSSERPFPMNVEMDQINDENRKEPYTYLWMEIDSSFNNKIIEIIPTNNFEKFSTFYFNLNKEEYELNYRFSNASLENIFIDDIDNSLIILVNSQQNTNPGILEMNMPKNFSNPTLYRKYDTLPDELYFVVDGQKIDYRITKTTCDSSSISLKFPPNTKEIRLPSNNLKLFSQLPPNSIGEILTPSIIIDGEEFTFNVLLNADKCDIELIKDGKKLHFDIEGPAKGYGWGAFRVTLPHKMLGGNYTVLADGLPIFHPPPTVSPDNNYTSIFFDYRQSVKSIDIIGTTIFPGTQSGSDQIKSFSGSPLKQFKSGTSTDEIKCKESLTRVTKYDSSPACVKPETKTKLIERGWTMPVSLLETQFKEIKYKIEQTSYDICNIKLEENKIIIDLNWIFNGSSAEKEIISKIPSYVDYEIIYHEGYTDYFINEMTANTCDQLENTK